MKRLPDRKALRFPVSNYAEVLVDLKVISHFLMASASRR
jgi:hypothetical protein